MNECQFVGKLNNEFKVTTGEGWLCAKSQISVWNPLWKKNPYTNLNFEVWGKSAEYVVKNAVKGDMISITGSIKTGSYEAKDGTKRYTTDVVVSSIQLLTRRDKPTIKSEVSLTEEFNFEDVPF